MSVSRSASAAASRSASAARTEDISLADDDKVIFASALGIPLHLTDRANTQKGEVQINYAKWTMIQKGEITRKRMVMTLPKKFVLDDVIELFMSKSAYYVLNKVFTKLDRFPEMEDWLRNDEDAPSKVSVWGSQKKPSFNLLKSILEACPPPSEEGSPLREKKLKGLSLSHKGKK
jgi:hypothetical protein